MSSLSLKSFLNLFNKHKVKVLVLAGLVALNVLFVFSLSPKGPGELKVHFFDVGQGDAIFIETIDGKQVLIDGGPDNKVIQKLSKAMPFWDRTIDLVILTHQDADHLTGLLEVLKRYKVKGVIDNGVECSKPACLKWEELKKKEKTLLLGAKLGDSVSLDQDTKILILHPFDELTGKKVSKFNNASVVAKLIFGGYSFLLTGDIEKSVENKLVLAGIDIDSDYLKIPHHGSKSSTTGEFLESVSPLLAVISLSANNRYGHPHEVVLERLEKKFIKYYRTDTDGDVVFKCRRNSPCQTKTAKKQSSLRF